MEVNEIDDMCRVLKNIRNCIDSMCSGEIKHSTHYIPNYEQTIEKFIDDLVKFKRIYEETYDNCD